MKQEAEEKAKKRTKGFKCQDNCEKSYVMGALDFAEPREKRIAELEVTNKKISNECHKLVGTLEKKQKEIAELEAQIKEMKCCGNCAKRGHICVAEEMQGKLCGKNKDKWELRR